MYGERLLLISEIIDVLMLHCFRSYAVNSPDEQFQTARYMTRQRDGPPTKPPSQVSSGPPMQRPVRPPTQRPSGPSGQWPGGQPGSWPARGTAQWPVRPAAPPEQYSQQRTLGGPGTMVPPLPVHGAPVMRDPTAQERFLREIQQCPERLLTQRITYCVSITR